MPGTLGRALSHCQGVGAARFAVSRGLGESDQVMEKVDSEGNVLGFSVLKVSAIRIQPLDVAL